MARFFAQISLGARRCFLSLLLTLWALCCSQGRPLRDNGRLPPRAAVCLALRPTSSAGFPNAGWGIPGETLQSFMSYPKHFIWELSEPRCERGDSHCPPSRACGFGSSDPSWLVAGLGPLGLCFSYRITAIRGEANPSLPAGKGCVVCGSSNTYLTVNRMPRVARGDVYLIASNILERSAGALFPQTPRGGKWVRYFHAHTGCQCCSKIGKHHGWGSIKHHQMQGPMWVETSVSGGWERTLHRNHSLLWLLQEKPEFVLKWLPWKNMPGWFEGVWWWSLGAIGKGGVLTAQHL